MLNQMYEQYCANRLPCGICRLTNSQCPKCGVTITTTTATPAFDYSKVTCTTSSKAKGDIPCTYTTSAATEVNS